MNEQVIEQILWFMEIPEMRVDGCYPNLRERSWRRWAAGVVLEALLDHPNIPASRVIDELRLSMLGFVYSAPTESCRFIFQTAIDTIEMFYDMI